MINADLYERLKKSAKNHIVLDLFCNMPKNYIDVIELSVDEGKYTQYEYEKFMTLIGFKRFGHKEVDGEWKDWKE